MPAVMATAANTIMQMMSAIFPRTIDLDERKKKIVSKIK